VLQCDERRPICLNCERGKRSCTGALSPFLVTTSLAITKASLEYESLSSRPIKASHVASKLVLSDRTHSKAAQQDLNQAAAICLDEDRQDQYDFGSTTTGDLSPGIPLSTTAVLAAEIVEAMHGKAGYELSHFGVYMTLLIPRLGQNATLDAAARTLVMGHHELTRPDPFATSRSSLYVYHAALSLLREDLRSIALDPKQPIGDVFCTVTLLSAYELLKQDAGRAHLAHAGGTAALLRNCGANRLQSDFEMALFLSQYGTIVMNSILSGTDSFLDDSQWESLRQRSLLRWPEYDTMASESVSSLTMLSPLLRSVRALAGADDPGFASAMNQAREFKRLVHKHDNKYEAQLENPDVVSIRPESNPISPYADQYHFRTIRVAFRFGMHWGTAIVAARILQRLHDMLGAAGSAVSQALYTEIRFYAQRIMQSLPYVRKYAPFGALFMTFPLQVVAAAVDGSIKLAACTALAEMLQPLGIPWNVKWIQVVGDLMTGAKISLPYRGRTD
jgi:hypothetical protein